MTRPKYYQKKAIPGDAYVTDTDAFFGLVLDLYSSLPKKWELCYTKPLMEAAQAIDFAVNKANRVVILPDKQPAPQVIENIKRRIYFLEEALYSFETFDKSFDRLMMKFDILDTDFRRMYAAIEEAVLRADPKQELKIKVHGDDRFFSYTADIDGECVKIHFSREKKDRLLDAEVLSKKRITEKRTADGRWLKSLSQ